MREFREFLDVSESIGMTDVDVLKKSWLKYRKGIKCVSCGEDAVQNAKTFLGLKEITLSGLCEKCFDEAFSVED